jgi:hypothetical protein
MHGSMNMKYCGQWLIWLKVIEIVTAAYFSLNVKGTLSYKIE